MAVADCSCKADIIVEVRQVLAMFRKHGWYGLSCEYVFTYKCLLCQLKFPHGRISSSSSSWSSGASEQPRNTTSHNKASHKVNVRRCGDSLTADLHKRLQEPWWNGRPQLGDASRRNGCRLRLWDLASNTA